MNDAELLNAWDEAPLPPARDGAFRIAVLQKLERRRFAQRMSLVFALGAAAIAGVLAFAPDLAAAVRALPPETGLAVIVLVILGVPAWALARAFRFRLV